MICRSSVAVMYRTLAGLVLSLAVFAVQAQNFERKDVTIKSAGLNMAGWLYVPKGMAAGEKRPAIVMAHGWSATKEMYLDDYAAKFANGGFVVTVFDYRNLGGSQGEPLNHLDP